MGLNFRKIWTVASTEYRQFVLTKTFIVLLLLSPAMIAVFIGVTLVAESSRDLEARSFVVVDRTERLMRPLVEAADQHNQFDIYEFENGIAGIQIAPRFLPGPYDGPSLPDQELLVALSERVRAGEIFAFVIIDEGAFDGSVDEAIRYYSQNQTYQALPRWLERTLNRSIQNLKLEDQGIDPELVRKLTERLDVERYRLAEINARGELVEPEKENEVLAILLPLGAMMLLFFCANMSSPIMLNSVMEEKMQKIVEILLASVKPVELMSGKLIGSVLVAVTLGAVYLAPSFGFLLWRGYGDEVPMVLLAWFPVFLILTLLSIGSIWAAIGAACSELKDTQNFAGFAILFLMVPFFLSLAILESPNTPFAVTTSLIPGFYPFVMTIRLCTAPGPAAWELWVGLFLSLLFTLFCIWAGARIFRRGILAQGNTPSLVGLIHWLRSDDV